MNNVCRLLLAVAGINGALATILAAMASHNAVMANNPYLTSVFAKANNMHFIHLLALVGVTLLFHITKSRLWLISAGLFVLGMVLFCTTLYLFAFSGVKIAGFLTPLGGISFILGWGGLLLAAVLNRDGSSR